MRRLYLKIYLALVVALVAAFVVSGLLFWHPRGPQGRDVLRSGERLLAATLPGAGAPRARLEERVRGLADAVDAGIAVFDRDGTRLAEAGPFVALPDLDRRASHWRVGHPGRTAMLRLGDGRWVGVTLPPGPPHAGTAGFALVLVALALAAWPVARGITRRLEALRDGVQAFGAGDLAARAHVGGRDEIALVGAAFDRAAERVEALLRSQRSLLASASHELRSPLARLRMAAELLEDAEPERVAALRERIKDDVGRLDAAVEELLVAARLDLLDPAALREPVDLLALAAEEAARVDAQVEGEPARVRGDARALRHLVRNLISNALRHAPGGAPEVAVRSDGAEVVLEVADRGPGIPATERERVFEPFHKGAGHEQPGMGLGLSLVREIARQHGGGVEALAREGGGALLRVRLPAIAPDG